MKRFFEPNYEAGEHIRWFIGMRDESPFAVAGLYREWEEEDGSIAHAFTQLTINADEHSLMKRFHKNGEEKRQLVCWRAPNIDQMGVRIKTWTDLCR